MSHTAKELEGPHLVLGGSGFVGRHVALTLARMGHTVIASGRNPPGFEFPVDVRDRIDWLTCDTANVDWAAMIAKVSVIYHLAWTTIPATANADPQGDLLANVNPTVSLLETMRHMKAPPRLIFASSGGTVYGRLQNLPAHEDHRLQPITAYGVSKASVEFYLGYYRAVHGLDCRVARLANPFGAGQKFERGQGAVTIFLHLALTGQPITIWGDGETVRDYIHVSDASAGIVAVASAARAPDAPWTFNIASGRGVSLNAIIAELEARFHRTLDVRREPGRTFDVPVSVLDVSRAIEALGWSPRLSFSDGVARTVADLERDADFSTLGDSWGGLGIGAKA